MQTAITAIGIANPSYTRPQAEIAELICNSLRLTALQQRILKAIYKSAGIAQRYSVLEDYEGRVGSLKFFPNDSESDFPSTAQRMELYKNNALNLALTAITDCFNSRETFHKETITHIIIVSCTGMYAPGLDIEIVHQLNLPTTTLRTCIQFMGCYGAFNALRCADDICRATPDAKVLIVSVELCTLHFQKKFDIQNIMANAIFADGAAAVIVEANPKLKTFISIENFYSDLIPQSTNEMAWTIADSGFDIVLSSYVPDVIENGIKLFAEKLLLKSKLTNVDLYAIHPGGKKILKACEKALNLTTQNTAISYEVLKNYGNMSSATILFIFKKLWEQLDFKDNAKTIFSCAFGPGLTLESALLKWHCAS